MFNYGLRTMANMLQNDTIPALADSPLCIFLIDLQTELT